MFDLLYLLENMIYNHILTIIKEEILIEKLRVGVRTFQTFVSPCQQEDIDPRFFERMLKIAKRIT